jgi:hypothetical protein
MVTGVLSAAGLAVAADDKGGFELARDREAGTLTLKSSNGPVLSFVYKPRLKEGVDPKYRRTGYVHPLYDLDGEPITADFPKDHYHHRGLWLSWPRMWYQGQKVQLWQPSPLKQRFEKVLAKQMSPKRGRVELQNNWVLDGEPIGQARWTITAYPKKAGHRIVDFAFTLRALNKPIKLQGKTNANKGYGGLSVRTAPSLVGGRLLTNKGALNSDSVQKHYQWVDLANDQRGVAVMPHPGNVNSPAPWLIRNSYGGVLNPEWPGLKKTTLKPGQPVTLRYRVVVHRGKLESDKLNQLFKQWGKQAE